MIFIILISASDASGQQGSNFQSQSLIPQFKTPETDGFEKYVSVPVAGNTGTPDISIPIYTLSYGGLEVPISLSYDASGVKVDEVASEVGLKWNLNFGGSLSRVQRGGTDEGENYQVNDSPANLHGFYKDRGFNKIYPFIQSRPYSSRLTDFYLIIGDATKGIKDFEPDLFSYNVAGLSGRFHFDTLRNIRHLTSGDVRVKEYYDPARGNLDSRFYKWEVRDPSGILYTFGNAPAAIEKSFSGAQFNVLSHFVAQAWKLTKMTSPVTGRSIDFVYKREAYVEISASGATENLCFQSWGTSAPTSWCPGISDPAQTYQSFVINQRNNGIGGEDNVDPLFSDARVLSAQIDMINGGTDIQVRFYRSQRQDLMPMNGWETQVPTRIDSIKVFYKTSCIKTFSFSYTYVTAADDPITNKLSVDRRPFPKKRLILASFEEKDLANKSLKKYIFEYQDVNQLPSRTSFARDNWGYYNGANANQSLFPKYQKCVEFPKIANRRVSETKVGTGTLTRITYPTKGQVSFEYECHNNSAPTYTEYQWSQKAAKSTGFGAALNSTTKTLGVTFTISGNPADYRLVGTIGKATWLYSQTDCNALVGTAYAILGADSTIKYSYGYSGVDGQNDNNNGSEQINVALSNLVSNQTYRLKVFGYSAPGASSLCYYSDLRIEKIEPMPSTSSDYLVGGLRVKNIKHVDEGGNVLLQKGYSYQNPKLIYNPKFVYPMMLDFDYAFNGLIELRRNVVFYDQFGQPMQYTWEQDFLNYYAGHSKANFMIVSAADPFRVDFTGSHISYEKVIEDTGNGTIENYFFLPKSLFELNGFSTGGNEFPPPPVHQDDLAGKLWWTLIKDAGGNPVKKNFNLYTITTYGDSVEAIVFSGLQYQNSPYVATKRYALQSQHVRLTQTTTTLYHGGTEYVQSTRNFYQGNGHHQVTRTASVTNAGDSAVTRMYYPPDLPSEPNASTLIAQNRLSPLKVKVL